MQQNGEKGLVMQQELRHTRRTSCLNTVIRSFSRRLHGGSMEKPHSKRVHRGAEKILRMHATCLGSLPFLVTAAASLIPCPHHRFLEPSLAEAPLPVRPTPMADHIRKSSYITEYHARIQACACCRIHARGTHTEKSIIRGYEAWV